MAKLHRWALYILTMLIVATLGGCAGSSQPPASPQAAPTASDTPVPNAPTATAPPPVTPTAPPAVTQRFAALAAGKALLQAQCAACHALSSAAMSGTAAPALDGIGARRTRHWLEVELVDPCSHPNAGGTKYRCEAMPSFSGLTPQQRDQIVLYLLSQR
jgi:mono/diheme cytochrome c family protein